jgi:hypothetical protein
MAYICLWSIVNEIDESVLVASHSPVLTETLTTFLCKYRMTLTRVLQRRNLLFDGGSFIAESLKQVTPH